MLILASLQDGAVEFSATDSVFVSDSQRNCFFVLFCFVFLNDGLNYLMRMLGNIDSIKLQYCSLSRKENDVFAFSIIFYFNCRRYFKLCSEILRWIFKLKM